MVVQVLQRIFLFSKEGSHGNRHMKSLLGGKGANLAEMSRLGLNVPPGFTITTEMCAEYNRKGKKLPEGLWDEVLVAIQTVEAKTLQKFGDVKNPLLLSVRSGAAVSMPGMMDTVLDLGLNDEVASAMAKVSDPRFVWDCYRRLLDMFASVVLGLDHKQFERELAIIKREKGVEHDTDLDAEDLVFIVAAFKDIYWRNGFTFPQDPYEQLEAAVCAVFDSWDKPNAVKYREINKISALLGTAVNVQSMVFGNRNANSGTGVLFTRDPATGTDRLYGEFLIDAQGEDVVAGIRTPVTIGRLKVQMPAVYKELYDNVKGLERHYGDVMDVEFTIQDGELFMLQCRSGKRTGQAALKIAVDMVDEGIISKEQAVLLVEPRHLDQMLHPQFADEALYAPHILARGLAASPGAAVGQLCFTPDDAVIFRAKGGECILVREETSPDDIAGMNASKGILTCKGGMTSHAAVVARGWGKPCVCGCGTIEIDEKLKTLTVGGRVLRAGDWVSLNGATGEVIFGQQRLAPPPLSGDMAIFMSWVDCFREMKVFTNADTPHDAAEARKNGAQGIGLVRTEHMFFEPEARLRTMRLMIMSDTREERTVALERLVKHQTQDFEGIFEAMDGLPVTIRLIDPPLHEFLPRLDAEAAIKELADDLNMTQESVKERIRKHQEVNPMLGLRGCRLGIMHPEISEMQATAIFTAALNVKQRGITAVPDIMIPLVGSVQELVNQDTLVRRTAQKVFDERGDFVEYKVGTMIEVPRAALMAGDMAKHTEFFSFGTNDLTQMTFGFSRDDAGTFLPKYVREGILQSDPFQVLDKEGVGQLIRMAVERGRSLNPELIIGICGEHGGDPTSIEFLSTLGLDYVSCSPFRVPIARLACAQAACRLRSDAK